jgi:hypothetical protein
MSTSVAQSHNLIPMQVGRGQRVIFTGGAHFLAAFLVTFLAAFLATTFLGAAFLATFLATTFLGAALVTFLATFLATTFLAGAAALRAIESEKRISDLFKEVKKFLNLVSLTPPSKTTTVFSDYERGSSH